MKVLLKLIIGVLCCICAMNFCVVAQETSEDSRQLLNRKPLIERIRQRITPIQDHIHQHHNGLWGFLNHFPHHHSTVPSQVPTTGHHHHHHHPFLHGIWQSLYSPIPAITTTTTVDAGKMQQNLSIYFLKFFFLQFLF